MSACMPFDGIAVTFKQDLATQHAILQRPESTMLVLKILIVCRAPVSQGLVSKLFACEYTGWLACLVSKLSAHEYTGWLARLQLGK